MRFIPTTSLWLSLMLTPCSWALKNGDTICHSGYIVDVFCVNRGTFLDKPTIRTLEHPEQHSFHCMFDPQDCLDSGYVILQKDGDSMYSPAYAFNPATNAAIIVKGRKLGAVQGADGVDCTTCSGTDPSVTQGFHVGIYATVIDAEASPPVVSATSIQLTDPDQDDYCMQETPQVKTDDSICYAGYVVDNFCIDRGTFLDNSSVMTLQNPEQHSYHCMFDPGVCVDSGYVILEKPATEGGMYTQGYALDAAANAMMVEKGRALGARNGDSIDCTTCTGTDSSITHGVHVGVWATVTDATVDPPVIAVQSMQIVDSDIDYCSQPIPAMESGDVVCHVGYVVDNFCIDRGTFLDNANVRTLENPEQHSYHCMFDPSVCVESGYVILKEPTESGGLYTQAYALDDAGNDMLVTKGRAVGARNGDTIDCTTCSGTDSSKTHGVILGVRGMITDAFADPPVIAVTHMEIVDATSSDYCSREPNKEEDPPGDDNSGVALPVASPLVTFVGFMMFLLL